MYVGELNSAMGIGDIMGHEAIGIVEEVRPEGEDLKVGGLVIILSVIARDECFYCRKKEYSLCDKTNLCKEM
jgi:threonine dehydrogenase-like Zn-dependent dehydrogenase